MSRSILFCLTLLVLSPVVCALAKVRSPPPHDDCPALTYRDLSACTLECPDGACAESTTQIGRYECYFARDGIPTADPLLGKIKPRPVPQPRPSPPPRDPPPTPPSGPPPSGITPVRPTSFAPYIMPSGWSGPVLRCWGTWPTLAACVPRCSAQCYQDDAPGTDWHCCAPSGSTGA